MDRIKFLFNNLISAIKSNRKLMIGLIVVAVLAVGIFAWIFIDKRITLHSYKVEAQTSDYDNEERCVLFADGILKYSPNGIRYTNDDDVVLWEKSLAMSNPEVVYNDSYALMYDVGGNLLVLCDKTDIIKEFSVSAPITIADIAQNGVSAVMIKGTTDSYINYFDNTGRQLEIELRHMLGENSGYPLSLAISPSAQGLVMPLVYVDGGKAKTKMTFYNFDVGKDKEDRIVGQFEYDILFPEVKYISNKRVVAFGEDQIVFYSLSNEAKPEVSKVIKLEDKIKSVKVADGFAAVVFSQTNGGEKLCIYDKNGFEILSEPFDFNTNKLDISNGYVMAYDDISCIIATTEGHIRFTGEFEETITSMTSIGTNKFLQYGSFGARIIKLN